jgi:hypothetical protein
MVTCCITPTCCDTDTVCVNIVQGGVAPQWMIGYASVCLNGAPVGLDASNIFYTNVFPWVPNFQQFLEVDIFSGTNVVGNYFLPKYYWCKYN